MKFSENYYYHLYNRTNNEEALFRSEENYRFFLKKYRFYLDEHLETIAYCLMPTHFHFLVKVKPFKPSEDNLSDDLKLSDKFNDGKSSDKFSKQISMQIGILLRSYTRAFNNMWKRHGNLFNQKTKAKPVTSDKYLVSLVTYIHQNPVHSNLVDKAEDWHFSSFKDYIDERQGTLPNKSIVLEMISKDDLKDLTNKPSKPSEGFKPSDGWL